MSRSCGRPSRVSPSCSDLADAWLFPYTDFGELHALDLVRCCGPRDRCEFPVDVERSRPSSIPVVPRQGTSVILGQIGFLERFTVTFGPERFAVEPGDAFDARFGHAR